MFIGAGKPGLVRRTAWISLVLAMSAIIVELAVSQEKPVERGKAVFIASKCGTCHSVEAADIPRKPKQRNPDLSTAGDSADATYWQAYLRRQRERNGRTHLGPWSGSDADLDSLSHWIGSLRSR
ncbi:MAG: c-type cytochrome [Bacteroidota bacterium]